MTLLDIPMPKNEMILKRSFDGPTLKVHQIKYEIGTDGAQRTAFIIAEDYPAAELLLVKSLPRDARFHIISMGDNIHEIHGISPKIEEQLFNLLAEKYTQPEKAKLSDRFRSKKK